ncbi:hypothetical protein JW926_13880 [Candidatus Sumerlaeota bacterium]|nr:hypothetical protein [Candidatus Sumerlaeota bacterium]
MKEKRFQISLNIFIAVLSFLLGIGASYIFQIRSERIQRISLAKLIRATVTNDLHYTISTTVGIRNQIMKKKFTYTPTTFNLIYSPTVTLPSGDNLGSLEPSIVNALDEYRRRIIACEKQRSEYLNILEGNLDNYIEMALLTYYISLDSVVCTGINLLSELDKKYPERNSSFHDFDDYIRAEENVKELIGIVDEVISEKRMKNK